MQVLCATVLLVVAPPARAQHAPLTRQTRRALADSLRATLDAAVRDHAFPGAFLVVGDSHGPIIELGAGHLDWAASPAPTPHTLWDLASLTKVIGTTTALAQLVERGAVALDAPVQRYVPDWRGPGKDAVTIRHLLTHTSGLPAYRNYDQQTHDPDSLAALLFATELERAPGDSMVYSDIGAFMMGTVVARVTGERLDAWLASHVFGPLGMHETMFNPPRALWDRVAPTEIDSTRGGLLRGRVHDERAYYLGGVAAHAGLFSSAADLSRFATMLLRGGTLDSVTVLGAATLATFTVYADSARSNRALGWEKPPASWAGSLMPGAAYGHTGFTGTSIAVDPTIDVFIILLTNRVNPTRDNPKMSGVRRHVADVVEAALAPWRATPSTSRQP